MRVKTKIENLHLVKLNCIKDLKIGTVLCGVVFYNQRYFNDFGYEGEILRYVKDSKPIYLPNYRVKN